MSIEGDTGSTSEETRQEPWQIVRNKAMALANTYFKQSEGVVTASKELTQDHHDMNNALTVTVGTLELAAALLNRERDRADVVAVFLSALPPESTTHYTGGDTEEKRAASRKMGIRTMLMAAAGELGVREELEARDRARSHPTAAAPQELVKPNDFSLGTGTATDLPPLP